jgi:alpha-tubulin suppressor-like RCC1 family protein
VDVLGLSSGVVAISGGGQHTCAVKGNGSAVCWGVSSRGQLGNGSLALQLEPTGVLGLGGGVLAISAGHVHTCALTGGGAVLCWGDNLSGELGDGSMMMRSTPVSVVGLDSGVAAISAGTDTTCALTTAGKVECWGQGSTGALGDGDPAPRNTPTEVQGL